MEDFKIEIDSWEVDESGKHNKHTYNIKRQIKCSLRYNAGEISRRYDKMLAFYKIASGRFMTSELQFQNNFYCSFTILNAREKLKVFKKF